MKTENLKKYLKRNKKKVAVICIVLFPLSVSVMVILGISALFYSAIRTIYGELLTGIDKL